MLNNDRPELEQVNSQLKQQLLQKMPEPSKLATAIGGLVIARRDVVNQTENCFGKPSVAVILQGVKCAVIGSEEYHYGANQCVVTGVDMPSSFYIIDASSEHPFLAIALELDRYLLTRLAAEVPPSTDLGSSSLRGVSVTDVSSDVLLAFGRLLELLDKPDQIPILAPMIIREIHYRLLIGPQGECLRRLNTLGTQGNQIANAISWLRDNYKEPLQVDTLAKRVNMATSTFHRHFKEVTSLSPLQFHKRLRLYEAQRLMLAENEVAASASLEVGYESPTQFNREYKRLFGEPPHRDVMRFRAFSAQHNGGVDV